MVELVWQNTIDHSEDNQVVWIDIYNKTLIGKFMQLRTKYLETKCLIGKFRHLKSEMFFAYNPIQTY